jgi:voltage-gated potassium channel Kch
MLRHVGIGVALLVATTALHAGAMALAFEGLKLTHASRWVERSILTRTAVVASLVVLMFLTSLVESGLWALVYLAVDALPSFEEALYFSMVTFTTLGYGDVTLGESWRLLGSFEAANGTVMFGWTTALIVAVVHRVYLQTMSESRR